MEFDNIFVSQVFGGLAYPPKDIFSQLDPHSSIAKIEFCKGDYPHYIIGIRITYRGKDGQLLPPMMYGDMSLADPYNYIVAFDLQDGEYITKIDGVCHTLYTGEVKDGHNQLVGITLSVYDPATQQTSLKTVPNTSGSETFQFHWPSSGDDGHVGLFGVHTSEISPGKPIVFGLSVGLFGRMTLAVSAPYGDSTVSSTGQTYDDIAELNSDINYDNPIRTLEVASGAEGFRIIYNKIDGTSVTKTHGVIGYDQSTHKIDLTPPEQIIEISGVMGISEDSTERRLQVFRLNFVIFEPCVGSVRNITTGLQPRLIQESRQDILVRGPLVGLKSIISETKPGYSTSLFQFYTDTSGF